jgi:hypothetical protein
MFRKIKDLLYAVVHAHGRLFGLTANLGPIHASLWVGRENPDAVSFALTVALDYGAYLPPALAIEAEVGVIKIAFYLARE